jgi:glycosyltransferase involved in cell wall biosynthesis
MQPEVVHSYSFFTNFPAYFSTLGLKSLSIGSVRSDFNGDRKDAGWWLGPLCSRLPRYQIYNSEHASNIAKNSRSSFVPRQICVVSNGVDLAQFPSCPTGELRGGTILGVGSLVPIKRWDRLLEAAKELKKDGYDFRIRIAGDGPCLGPLTRKAQRLELEDRVEFLGHAEDLRKLFTKTSFLVHTSDMEGCPNVIMEAMASGRPVVATDVGDVPVLVENGKTGFVVPRKDPTSLVDAMKKLITNKQLCAQMGKAGRIKALREFNLDRFVQKTFNAYQQFGWRTA